MTTPSPPEIAKLLEIAADPHGDYPQLSTNELQQAQVLERQGLIEIVGTPETGCSLLLTDAGRVRLAQERSRSR